MTDKKTPLKETKKEKSVPCKYCSDDYPCLDCKDKMQRLVNTFWWD